MKKWLSLLLATLLVFLQACRTSSFEPAVETEEHYPDEELVSEASVMSMMSTPAWVPTWQPPQLDTPTKLLTQNKSYMIKGATNGLVFEDTQLTYTGNWGAWMTYDGEPHTRTRIEDFRLICAYNPADRNTWAKWGFRDYEMEGLYRRVWVSGVYWEHGQYTCPRGSISWVDCFYNDCGAQGIQVRHNLNRADPEWSRPRLLRMTGVTTLECGQVRGAGRAGFSVSVKDMGPETDVVMTNIAVRTVEQRNVRTSGSLVYHSFGGICVEYCRNLTISDSWVELLQPDRPAIQLYDFSRKQPTKTGPENIDLTRTHVANGAHIAVRKGDGKRINIQNCTGTGRILVYNWNGSDWKLNQTESRPIASGYYFETP